MLSSTPVALVVVRDAESLSLEIQTLSGETQSLGGHSEPALTGLQGSPYHRFFELFNGVSERPVNLDRDFLSPGVRADWTVSAMALPASITGNESCFSPSTESPSVIATARLISWSSCRTFPGHSKRSRHFWASSVIRMFVLPLSRAYL